MGRLSSIYNLATLVPTAIPGLVWMMNLISEEVKVLLLVLGITL